MRQYVIITKHKSILFIRNIAGRVYHWWPNIAEETRPLTRLWGPDSAQSELARCFRKVYPGSIIGAAVGLLLVNELSYWSVRVSSEKEKEGRKREVDLVRVRPGRHVPLLQVTETPHQKILDIESSCTRKCNDLNSEASCLENWLKQKKRKKWYLFSCVTRLVSEASCKGNPWRETSASFIRWIISLRKLKLEKNQVCGHVNIFYISHLFICFLNNYQKNLRFSSSFTVCLAIPAFLNLFAGSRVYR